MLAIFYLSFLFLSFIIILISCQFNRSPISNPFGIDQEAQNEEMKTTSSSEFLAETIGKNSDYSQMSLFDYTKIKIEPTESIDIEIRNCNLYPDIYGDILIFGELQNKSQVNKTNIRFTFNFYDINSNEIDSKTIPSYIDYLREDAILPFCLIYDDKYKYIEISRVKIGVNYDNYKESFTGNPLVTIENFYYEENMLVIKGSVSNIGQNMVEDLKLFLTFYDFKNEVISIKQCYLPKDKLEELENEAFIVKVLLDEYLRNFTHYRIEIFFRDSLKV
jgi:hypothetical protein